MDDEERITDDEVPEFGFKSRGVRLLKAALKRDDLYFLEQSILEAALFGALSNMDVRDSENQLLFETLIKKKG